MAQALSRLDFLPPLRLQVNNRKLIEGFYRGVGAPDPAAVMRAIDKLDKLPADAVAEHADRARPGCRPSRPSCASSWPRSAPPIRPSPTRSPSSACSHELLDEGVAELRRSSTAACRSPASSFSVEADLSIARGLDYYTGTVFETRMAGLREPRLDLLGRALRLAGHRWHDDLPRRRHLARRDPLARPAAGPRRADGQPVRPVGRARGRGQRRDPGRRPRRWPTRCALAGIACEVAGSAQKYGRQIRARRAARHPVRLVPVDGYRRRGQRHPLGRPGAGRPRLLDAARTPTATP